MSRFGGLSEERPSVFKTRSKLGTPLSTQCSGDERQSRLCAARGRADAAPLPKIMHPNQPRFVEGASVSPPSCNGRPLLGRSSFVIEDNFSAKGRAHAAPLPKIVHPKQPQSAVVANFNPPKCNGSPLLGRSSFLIKDDSSDRPNLLPKVSVETNHGVMSVVLGFLPASYAKCGIRLGSEILAYVLCPEGPTVDVDNVADFYNTIYIRL
ncbi:hypothetical protein TNCV_565461 [Trichonephila clavipes]|nr:hypothetical protein TNCV_565461 [Trichonephila clavipes]